MVDFITPVKAAQVLAVGLIGLYTYRKDMLNAEGALTAFVLGSLIVLVTNFLLPLLLLGNAWVAAPLRVHVTAWTVILPAAMGLLGCQVDSVLGATLEGGGLFTKEETNLLSISAGAVLGLVLAALLHV